MSSCSFLIPTRAAETAGMTESAGEQAGLGDMLIQLGYLSPEKLKEALESQLDVLETVEELVLEGELCTPERVKIASQLLALQRNGALRRQVDSSFVPFNIMELLISERLDDALAEDDACRCSLCWSNAFSIALNELPARRIHGADLDIQHKRVSLSLNSPSALTHE